MENQIFAKVCINKYVINDMKLNINQKCKINGRIGTVLQEIDGWYLVKSHCLARNKTVYTMIDSADMRSDYTIFTVIPIVYNKDIDQKLEALYASVGSATITQKINLLSKILGQSSVSYSKNISEESKWRILEREYLRYIEGEID